MMCFSPTKQRGLTLIEMMIAMVVALILVGGVITMFVTSVRSNVDHMKMMRLNQDIRAVTALITRELHIANADEDAIYSAAIGADYRCDTCNVDVSQDGDKLSLDYAIYEDGAIKNKAFVYSGNAILFDSGSGNPESITLPETNYTDVKFEVEYLVGDVWVEVPNPSDPIDATKLNLILDAQTELSGGDTAVRSISKMIRVRN